jgi:signal transduction histidine kinase
VRRLCRGVDAGQRTHADGDPVLVERLVANLIDNAVRHNVADGWIEVSTGGRDGMAQLSVANGGPVIQETEVASLFEPFRRLCPHQGHEARDGDGLGLSIAASVVAAHHGKITMLPLPGGGLKVLVLLPASR